MDEGKIARALVAMCEFDLQLFAEEDPELGYPLEIDVDALGDDVGKLKSMLGKALHENKKVREQAGKRRIALREIEREKGDLQTQFDALTGEKTELTEKLETANRANGQYRSKFKEQLIDKEVRAALKEAGAIDVDVVAQALKRDAIACDDETFAVTGAEAVEAFKAEKAALFTPAQPKPGGTNRNGNGPAGGSGGSGGGDFVDYRDPSKSLEQLERESNIQKFGRATIGGGA